MTATSEGLFPEVNKVTAFTIIHRNLLDHKVIDIICMSNQNTFIGTFGLTIDQI